jgi:transcriptional regulator with XRE-family HTH domain
VAGGLFTLLEVAQVSGFPVLLRQLREDRGMSMVRLARASAVSPGYVSRLEAGKRQPARDVVERLAAAMRCTVAERDALLLAAGFSDGSGPRVVDINLLLLDEMLQDARLPDMYRQSVHDGIAALLRGCEAVQSRSRLAVVRKEAA